MKRMKKVFKSAITTGLCAALAANMTLPAYAASASITKDENIYATLKQDGSVSGIYVINEFSSESGGRISDYGDYTSVTNLTDQSELLLEDGHVTAEIPGGQFYYQGELEDQQLPWDISIRYFLDGDEISADALAGKSGALKIVIETKKNPDSQELFFEHYLLQATVVLNTETCTNIQAEDATQGNVGTNRQLVYTILPGEETELEITADVQAFEMDAITFQGVPLSLGISEDMLDEMDLSDQTEELIDAVVQLDDGVGQLKEGTEAAADGGKQLAAGISQLANGINLLKNGSSALTQGTSQLAGGTKELENGVSQYVEGVDSFAAGVEQYVAGVELLSQGSKQLAPLENLPLVDDAVGQMYQAVAVGDAQQGVPSLQDGAKSLADGLHMISEQVKLLENSTDAEKLQELLETLAQIQNMLAQLSGTLGEVSEAVGSSADMIEAIEASHQAVLDEVNRQISTANSDIAASVKSVNTQIDGVISAVQAAVEDGSLDEETANQTIASLNASKINQQDVSDIKLPQEDAEIQKTITALKETSSLLNNASEQFAEASQQLELAAEGIRSNLPSGDSGIAQLSQALSDACEGADALKTGVDTIGTALGQLKESTASFGEAGSGIAALNAGFDELCKNNTLLLSGGDALIGAKEDLMTGVAALTSGTDQLNDGAKVLSNGISTLHQGASLLDDHTGDLTSGLSALDEGTGKLKDGTQEFREQTDHMDETIQEKIEELLDEMEGDDFEPVSFLSEQNTNIGLVQFAITTDSIQIPEETETVEPEEEEGFMDRLLGLFR